MPAYRRRPTARRRRVTRRPRRPTRARRYTRRVIRRRPLTRRRILNVATTKKQDVRLCFTSLTGLGAPVATPVAADGAIMTGSSTNPYMMIYSPTMQDKTPGTTGNELPNYRDSQTCYMRGYKESIRFNVNNGQTWLWRRVCFTYKGTFLTGTAGLPANESVAWEVAPNGWTRPVNNTYATGTSGIAGRVLGEMFKGRENIDWRDLFTATLDPDRVNVKYDKFRTLRNTGGNADFRTHAFKIWHPMNANLIYDDDEEGQTNTSGIVSTTGNRSMGDYYIIDMFQCARNGTSATTDQLLFTPTGTLYWHEK